MSNKKTQSGRKSLFTGASILAAAAAALTATPAVAQDEEEEAIVVTGSRIARQDYVANSPLTTVSNEALVGNADVTVETYLNTLPQVNPAGTTTSNNPPNAGQANIDLRGLGANRNLVLIDGRRPMVSNTGQVVDVNTIPQALVERVEVITGGAGATYGADAVAGVVNFILRDDFEGADFRMNYSNSTEYWDAEEWSMSALFGANFADGRGNATFAFDHAEREYLTKGQRPYSAYATSTTPTAPEGSLRWTTGNPIPEAAVDALFATYGVGAGEVLAQSGTIGFNQDGTVFFSGLYNSPFDVQNYTDTDNPLNINVRYFPDFYSYNFDPVNALVLPYERDSFMGNLAYELDNGLEVFGRGSWTNYYSGQNLAPVPTPTVVTASPTNCTAIQVCSPLVTPGKNVGRNIIVPVTNPFIPADVKTLLAARVGDDPNIVDSGADEAFLIGFRPTAFGPRQNNFETTVTQFLIGLRGPLGNSGWDFDMYASQGTTEIDNNQTGNIQTQLLTNILAAPGGTVGACSYNPFGANDVSAGCVAALAVPSGTSNEFNQRIAQAYITGPIGEMAGGSVEAVVGAEYREFSYYFDTGSTSGPISGFNNGADTAGNNNFFDVFGELLLPVTSNVELSLGYRRSYYQFEDEIGLQTSDRVASDAYKAEVSWQVIDPLRLRASYQRSVRAPNFGELFANGSSAPQIFDPCSITSAARFGADGAVGGTGDDADGANQAQLAALCQLTGIPAGNINTFIGLPAVQTTIFFDGGPDLQPEEADTITLGLVFESPWDIPLFPNLRGSIDYYQIEIGNAIVAPDPNQLIAACYNYYGTNDDYNLGGADAGQYCTPLTRSGGDISFFNTTFLTSNDGTIETSGIDMQVDWGYDLGEAGSLRFNVVGTKLLEYLRQDTEFAPTMDYAGTVQFFGTGLGQSFPEWRWTITGQWDVGPFGLNVRARYIDAMENRLSVLFPGEYEAFGPPEMWYWDAAGSWNVTENATLRLGVNNIADEEPPFYYPNAQSGTDPSLYDVIGRRAFLQLNLRY